MNDVWQNVLGNTFMAQIRGRRLLLTRQRALFWVAFQRPQIYGQAKPQHPNQRLPGHPSASVIPRVSDCQFR